MIDILQRHTNKVLLETNLNSLACANLEYANLEYANLRGADLKYCIGNGREVGVVTTDKEELAIKTKLVKKKYSYLLKD